MKAKKHQIFLTAGCLLSLLLSLLTPFFSWRVLCLLLAIALVFSLSRAARKTCSRPLVKRLFGGIQLLILLGMAVLGILFTAVQIRMVQTESLPPEEDVDFVVVLGAKINGNRPSAVLQNRLDTALSFLNRHPEIPVIVCGGMGTDESLPEAAVMATVLEEGGIAPGRIFREALSTDTEENLRHAKEIILRQSGKEKPKILIVTSGFHLYRAGMIAESLGMSPSYLGAKGASEWIWEMNYRIREFCGVLTWKLGFR